MLRFIGAYFSAVMHLSSHFDVMHNEFQNDQVTTVGITITGTYGNIMRLRNEGCISSSFETAISAIKAVSI